MICITRHSPVCVTLEGHANSAAYGKDLICAAVSGLTLTLAANVEKLEGSEISLVPGDSRIQCGADAASVFDCICNGYELLAQRFPEYVCFLEIR